MAGDLRNVNPTAATRSDFPAASAIASASATVGAIGFSHSTCFPAASSASTIGRCRWFATTTLTASMSGAAATASQLVSARWYPYRFAASTAKGSWASATATSRISGRPEPNTVDAARYPLMCARPAIPAPITATPIEESLIPRSLLRRGAI